MVACLLFDTNTLYITLFRNIKLLRTYCPLCCTCAPFITHYCAYRKRYV